MKSIYTLPLWKRAALASYYYATWPYRAIWRWNRSRQGTAPLAVLFYHRVADEHPNLWTIGRTQFQQHLDWIRPRFDLVSLEELQRRMRAKESRRPAVAITFDDGYAENCEFALPLLIKERIPCTYFVTLQNVVEQAPFPHDAAIRQPLRPNTIEQLRALAAAGIEIGCHTRTHADLGQLDDPEELRDEIVGARSELAAVLERPIRYFAFPFGQYVNLSRAAFQLARDTGYEAVCSAYGGLNFPGDDPFHLQRLHGDPAMLRLMNDLTADPRKLYTVRRFADSSQPPERAAVVSTRRFQLPR